MKERPIPATGRFVGIDYGKRRIGLAISDAGRSIATPWDVYCPKDERQDTAFFRRLRDDEGVVLFVVGLPVHCDGWESELSQAARSFGQWLESATGVPVVFMDERFSSRTAETWLTEAAMTKKQRKKRLDKVAAQIILQAYLETFARRNPTVAVSWEPTGLDDGNGDTASG